MKKIFLAFTFLTLIACLFSAKTVAQTAPGGEADGFSAGVSMAVSPDDEQPSPLYFKRNNGNGFGVCGGDAEIRLSFGNLPTGAPVLVGIQYPGKQITTVIQGDRAQLATNGYISYCLSGFNLPPAHKLTLQFRYSNGQEWWVGEQ